MGSEKGQLDLFGHITSVYANAPGGAVDNDALYREAAKLAGISEEELERRVPIGREQKERSPIKQKIRWYQQTMKHLGLLERAERGTWRLTDEGKQKLRRIEPSVALLGYCTNLGLCVWGSCDRVFSQLDRPITLCVTSPPYLLRRPRAYGNPKDEQEYIDFICRSIEPVVRNLAPGGSICLNISNDVFEPGCPARSMYIERLLIKLHDQLGLKLMDRLVWENPNKPPGPIQWTSIKRIHLNVGYEPIYWLTNDPVRARSNNRRVLQQHTEKHLAYLRNGGEQRNASYCDGAYTLRAGKSFANLTEGKIPRNVLKFSNTCHDKRRTAHQARALGLPIHGATMPLELAKFLIQLLTGDGDDELVADIFAGWNTVGRAAEELGRPWIVAENIYEYVRGGAERFTSAEGFMLGAGLAGEL